MENLRKYLHVKVTPKKVSGGVNSAFNDAVDRAIQELKLDGKFGMWCGRLRGFAPQKIGELVSKAKGGERPAALFSWLVKKHKEEMKQLRDQ